MKFSEQNSMYSIGDDAHAWLLDEIGLLDFFESGKADLSRPQYDSRKIKPGDTFFAIRGFETDGHQFIANAIANGAMAIVLEEDSAFTREDAIRANVSRLLVKNSRLALAFVSEWAFGRPSAKLRMIGVTGTNGKTTVANIIRQLLTLGGEKVGMIGTVGIFIGDEEIPATHTTPESRDLSELLARMLAANVTTCVMEVSSHALALDRVAALDFDGAVFTNLTRDHLDFHHTMEAYFAAKQKLFDLLKDTAVAITNADDPNGLPIVSNTVANVHSYGIRKQGIAAHADLMAYNVQLSTEGSKFLVEKRYSNEHTIFESPLAGKINVENVLAAASALYFGIEGFSLESLAKLIPHIQPVRGRFERIALKNGAYAIIDYAHTPDALQNVIETIRAIIPPMAQIITIFGCGGERDKGKRPLMGEIAAKLSNHVIITSDNPRSEDPLVIIDDILAGIPDSERNSTQIEPDRAKAIVLGISFAKADDIVLIAGKGHENYQIIAGERKHFDDREEVLKSDLSY
jgi:UDP-N-acetylmuramoyl-L-alanyl-D-glutamate--2,6-diaminopimelate ligase